MLAGEGEEDGDFDGAGWRRWGGLCGLRCLLNACVGDGFGGIFGGAFCLAAFVVIPCVAVCVSVADGCFVIAATGLAGAKEEGGDE